MESVFAVLVLLAWSSLKQQYTMTCHKVGHDRCVLNYFLWNSSWHNTFHAVSSERLAFLCYEENSLVYTVGFENYRTGWCWLSANFFVAFAVIPGRGGKISKRLLWKSFFIPKSRSPYNILSVTLYSYQLMCLLKPPIPNIHSYSWIIAFDRATSLQYSRSTQWWCWGLRPCDKSKHFANETAVCLNPHNSSNFDSPPLDYYTVWLQNILFTHKICFSLKKKKNITHLLFGLPITFYFFLSHEKLCIGGLRQIGVSWATCCCA
jgi:hypothetical protein